MNVAITGSSGLVGRALMERLRERGDEVTRVVRSFNGVAPTERVIVWHPDKGEIDRQKLEGHDAVVHLATESLAGVWTPARRRRIVSSRVQGTDLIARAIAGLQQKPKVLVSASAVGYYGNDTAGPVDESAPAGTGFLAETCVKWETAAEPARQAGVRVVHTRFGLILSPKGGMIATLLPLVKLGLSAKLGSGDQKWPWITLDDAVAAILFALDRPTIDGPVNVVAPEIVTNAVMTDALAAAAGRPSLLKVPEVAVRLIPGGMGDQLLLADQEVVPRVLRDAGFEWKSPELRPALNAMLR